MLFVQSGLVHACMHLTYGVHTTLPMWRNIGGGGSGGCTGASLLGCPSAAYTFKQCGKGLSPDTGAFKTPPPRVGLWSNRGPSLLAAPPTYTSIQGRALLHTLQTCNGVGRWGKRNSAKWGWPLSLSEAVHAVHAPFYQAAEKANGID